MLTAGRRLSVESYSRLTRDAGTVISAIRHRAAGRYRRELLAGAALHRAAANPGSRRWRRRADFASGRLGRSAVIIAWRCGFGYLAMRGRDPLRR